MRHLPALIILFSMLPLCLSAKNKEHTLNGKIKVKDGDTYPYQLVFEVSHNTLKGYSVTKLPDGTDTKTGITGMIYQKKKGIIISETKLLSAPQKDVSICFVNAILTYKKKGNNYIISGIFGGKDDQQRECGSGTIEFVQPVAADDLYSEVPDTVKPIQTIKENKSEPAIDKDQITAGVQRLFDWNTDSCTLEVWDGGVIDGDKISLLVNDERVLTNYTLAKERKILRFPVTKKINTITVIAEDEGINPPNTVQLIFHDGSEQYNLTAFNSKGEKAGKCLIRLCNIRQYFIKPVAILKSIVQWYGRYAYHIWFAPVCYYALLCKRIKHFSATVCKQHR
jgi:hypothetical protein